MYRVRKTRKRSKKVVELMGAGTILREVEAAADILENDFKVAANVWSLTSVNELQREGKEAHRWNLLHPGNPGASLMSSNAWKRPPGR